MSHQFDRLRECFICLLTLVLLAAGGCIPEEQWLDDSSGFVYSVGKDYETQEIRFYDIARRAERVVWSGSNQAAFELDSAAHVLYLLEPRRGAGKPPFQYRLSGYDIKTSRLVRSTKWMSWNGNDPDRSVLYLSKVPSRENHFVVTDSSEGRGRHAILDSQKESFIDVPDVEPLEVLPDGSGFLAWDTGVQKTWDDSLFFKRKLDAIAIEKLCRNSVWFVDLNGARHGMNWDDSALRRAVALYGAQLKKLEAGAERATQSYKELFSDEHRQWQRNENGNPAGAEVVALLIGHEKGATRIDLKRRTLSHVAGLAVGVSEKWADLAPRLDRGPSVSLLRLKDVEYRLTILEKPTGDLIHSSYVADLEARWPAEAKSKILLNRVKIKGISMFMRVSPNRLYGVPKYVEHRKDDKEAGSRVHFLILDNDGNILDRISFIHNQRLQPDFVTEGIPAENIPKKAK